MRLTPALIRRRLEQSLREYLMTTSHDLRTPCHSVQTASALLTGLACIQSDGDAMALLQSIEGCCTLLDKLINNVLKLRQLHAGPSSVQLNDPSRLSVFNLPATLAKAQRELASASAITHEAGGAPLPAFVQGDKGHLTTCLENILLTAHQLSDAGPFFMMERPAGGAAERGGNLRISVSAAPEPSSTKTAVTATVRFACRPMKPEEIKAMLLPYGHAPSDMGGCTGLALQVAQGLAVQMDGCLSFLPEAPDGMQISLRLPFRVCAEGDEVLLEAHRSVSPGGGALPQHEGLPASVVPAVPPVETLTERMFEWLVNNSDDAFIICSVEREPPGLRISYVSPNVIHRLCYTQHELLGHDLSEFCHPEDRQRVGEEVAAALAGSRNLLSQHRNLTKTGETVWCETSGWTDTRSFFLVCRDVRHRKKSELELRSFAASTSADLREPCNGILIITALLEQRAGLSAEASALLAVIRASCGLLLGIVANVLTAKLVESGELTLHAMLFDPQAAISDIVQVCRLGCGVNAEPDFGIRWTKQELPALVEGDRDRILQIAQNIITNACKFGGGEPVQLCTSVVRIPAGGEDPLLTPPRAGTCGGTLLVAPPPPIPPQQRVVLSISVHNKGAGMSAEELNTCFEGYKHTSAAAGGGSGLGLYISRAFAQLLGGRLSATSEKGETVFTLSVPLRVPTPDEVSLFKEATPLLMDASSSAVCPHLGAADRRQPNAAKLAVPVSSHEPALRILVADDHALNLNLVSRLLGKSGFVVTPVKDGKEALDALVASFGEASAASSFHCAVLDMQMPVMTGYECAHAFRAWESVSGNAQRWGKLPLVALTANVLEEHVSQCFDSGMVRRPRISL